MRYHNGVPVDDTDIGTKAHDIDRRTRRKNLIAAKNTLSAERLQLVEQVRELQVRIDNINRAVTVCDLELAPLKD